MNTDILLCNTISKTSPRSYIQFGKGTKGYGGAKLLQNIVT